MDNLTPLTCQKHLFDLEEGIVSMATASNSPLLKSSIAIGQDAVAIKGRPWHIDEKARRDQAEVVRGLFAALVGVTANDIAIQPSVAFGIATAAGNVSIAPGQSFLVIEDQFRSNVLMWRRLANDKGANVVVVPRPDNSDWTTAILDHIAPDIAVAALPPAHWMDGTKIDLVAVSEALRPHDAMLIVDATQWIGAQPFDIAAVDPDFMVCAAYKWLLSPYGLAFMYSAPRHHKGRPLDEHGNNHAGDDYSPGGRRYDAGQYLNFISLPMVQDSMTQVADWRPERIGPYLQPLTQAIAEAARGMGLQCADIEFRSPHILGLRHPNGFSDDILDRLMALGVHVNARGPGLRISPYMHSDAEDVPVVIDALRKVI